MVGFDRIIMDLMSNLKGFAATDRDLSMFVEILEKSAHFNRFFG